MSFIFDLIIIFVALKLDWSLADEAIDEDCNEEERDLKYRKSVKCKVFLGFTSNLVSSGIRDTIRYLVEHHMVDVVVSTAGGIEEDLVKCLAPTYRGDFSLPGALLRSKGLNRIGNLLVPNDNYCKFEDWIIPIFDQMLKDQTEQAWILFKLVLLGGVGWWLGCDEYGFFLIFLFLCQNILWTPSKLIARLGKEINDRRSYLYWAYKARN